MNYKQARIYYQKRVLVLGNKKDYLGKIIDVKEHYLRIMTATDLSDQAEVHVDLGDINKIISKEHIRFLEPKVILSKTADAAVTHFIETVKKEAEFTLSTRKYKLQVNGMKKRSRWNSRDFEREAAKWLTTKTPLEICPFAIARVGKKETLLGVNRAYKLVTITKKLKPMWFYWNL